MCTKIWLPWVVAVVVVVIFWLRGGWRRVCVRGPNTVERRTRKSVRSAYNENTTAPEIDL